MKKRLLTSYCLVLAQASWGQANIYSNTAGQTQSLHATNSIELGAGFSSNSLIDITIASLLSATGQWATVPNWGLFIGIHTHVLPNGNVLSWQGHNDDPMTPGMVMGTDAYLWNPTRPMPTTHDFFIDWTNAFCTGHSFLADGKLLVTGGHYGNMISPAPKNNPYIQGLRDASTYDYTVTPPATTAAPAPGWQPEQRMARNRWYPTNTTLSNGDVLTTSGETEPDDVLPDTARYPELWQNGTWKRLTGAPKILPTYPWMFQVPNGKVFYAGPGNEMSYVNPYYVNPATGKRGTWTSVDVPNRVYPYRGQGTAAMFWPGRILVVGGSDGATVTNTAEVIDLAGGQNGTQTGADNYAYARPSVTPAGTMRNARHHINSTLLPDGTVLVTGGSRVPGSQDKGMGVLEAELWTPTPGPNGPTGPGTWTLLPPMQEARMYHSTAVLLPDGRVLSAGGEEVIKYDPFTPNVNNHCTAELYSPPYLFNGIRPIISYAPTSASYGQPLVFDTPTPAAIDGVTLVRLSSVTHSFNMNQRFLRLSITGRSATGVTAATPGTATECPPGHYLLFALRGGVPSEARVVAIGDNPCGATLALTASTSTSDCSATAYVSAGGTGLGSSYHWSIDGVYDSAYDGQPGISVALGPCRPQATVAVAVIPACGGAALNSSCSVSGGPFQQNGRFCLCEYE